MTRLRRLPALRVGAAALGAAAFGAGVYALFGTDNGAGSLFLLTLGTALLLVALAGDRIELESFAFFGANVKVREVVRRRLELADERSGSSDEALMRRQAQTLQKLAGLYKLYEHVRAMEPPSDRRTATLDQIAAQMQTAAKEAAFDPAEVSVWFHEGTDALRVVALNVMLVHKDCRDFAAVVKAVDEPRSLFEQFYALRLASAMLPDLDSLQRRLLRQALDRAVRRRRFKRDTSLMRMRESILAAL
jgi:hypothetical protein